MNIDVIIYGAGIAIYYSIIRTYIMEDFLWWHIPVALAMSIFSWAGIAGFIVIKIIKSKYNLEDEQYE